LLPFLLCGYHMHAGSSVADSTSSTAGRSSSVGNSTSSVADSNSSVADSTSSVADSTSSVADSTSSVADSTSSIADSTSSVGSSTSSVGNSTSSTAGRSSSVGNSTSSTDSIPNRIYTTLRIEAPPVIDGKLDDACWQLGAWQGDYKQYVPVYKAAPSFRTELKILYNNKSLFVAIRAYDQMDKVIKRLGRRDNYLGDIVGIQVDSYHDHRTAYEFNVTAAGQKMDIKHSDDGWDVNWDAVWYAKVAYEEDSWTAELEVPLSQLRYSPDPVQVWGFDSWRLISRLQEEDHWKLVANDGTGLVYTFGELHGLEGLPGNRRIELSPYISGNITTSEKIAGNPYAKGVRFGVRGGLDAKIGLSNNFTLDVTINPDFGQVEADPSEMNLSAFETYFEEKRPFFIEGNNIFAFNFDGDDLFYSRRIGHAPSFTPRAGMMRMPEFTTIGGAVKISGRTANGLSVGILDALTLKESAHIYENNAESTQAVEPLTNHLVGRFQQDFDRGNTILGGIVTHAHRAIRDEHLNFLGRDALSVGLDFTKFWADRKYFMEFKAIGTHVGGDKEAIRRLQTSSARYYQRPGSGLPYDTSGTKLSGMGASFEIGKGSKGHWRYSEEVVIRTPGLEFNDLGFMNLANTIENDTRLSYVEKENKWIFKDYKVSLSQENTWNLQGKGLGYGLEMDADFNFRNHWALFFGAEYKTGIMDEQRLRGGPSIREPDQLHYMAGMNTDYSKKFYFSLFAMYMHRMTGNFHFFIISPQLNYRPFSNLLLTLEAAYESDLDPLQYIGRYEMSTGRPFWLLGKVDKRDLSFTLRIDLAITPELTIQYYGSPFFSIGKFTELKEVTHPMDAKYENRFKLVPYKDHGKEYWLDRNGSGSYDLRIDNPGFNYQQFRSNLVLRWEYRPGSTLYFVWSQDRTGYHQAGSFSFGDGYKLLGKAFPGNIFMIKLNYWFGG